MRSPSSQWLLRCFISKMSDRANRNERLLVSSRFHFRKRKKRNATSGRVRRFLQLTISPYNLDSDS